MRRLPICVFAICSLACCMMASAARATTFTAGLPGLVFDGEPPFPTAPQAVGQYTFGPLDGPVISATLDGAFGTGGSSSAPFELYADGILVAECLITDPCFAAGGGGPFSYNFSPSEFFVFLDNVVDLTLVQTDQSIARLDPTLLTIDTIPEPSTALLLGYGVLGLAAVRRRGR